MVPAALRRPRAKRRVWLLALVLLLLAPAGCQREGRLPHPRGSLADDIRKFEAAVKAGDCRRIRSLAFYGNAQLKLDACKKIFLPQLAGFQPEDREQHRTAAVVDFTTKRAPGTMAFLVAKDRHFRWAVRLARSQGQKVVGTKPPARARLDATARAAVKAFRTDMCDELQKDGEGVVPDPSLPRQQCETADWLRKALRRDPSARPGRLGANSRLAFYSVVPRGGPHMTLVLQLKRNRAAFSSVFAVPRKARK